MKLAVFLTLLLTLDACQNPSRLQAPPPSGPITDTNRARQTETLGFSIPPGLLAIPDEVIE
jgi:hypothetical protein